MDPFALPSDIEAVWRPLTAEEDAIAFGLIEQASMLLRARVAGIDARAAVDPVAKAVAQAAVVNAVKRVLLNPGAVRQRSQTSGPFSESATLDSSISTGAVYIDPNDLVGLVSSTGVGLPRTARVRSGYPAPPVGHRR